MGAANINGIWLEQQTRSDRGTVMVAGNRELSEEEMADWFRQHTC